MFNGSQGAGFNAVSPQNSDIVSGKDVRQFQDLTAKGIAQQQGLYDTLNTGGAQNQANVFDQQQALAAQLQQQAAGAGPNPALAQLQQATGQNTAQQAALMAGQRGVGANAGLIARQAAQQGAGNQQMMVGQAATMQAQQQLAAQQALMQQQASMQNVAGAQVGQQMQQGNALTQNSLGATTSFLNAATGLQSNANNANASIAGANQKAQAGLVSGLMGGISGALSMASGGQVPSYAMGGDVVGGTGGSALSSFMNGQVGGIQNFGDLKPMQFGPSMGKKKGEGQDVAGGPMDAMGLSSVMEDLGPLALLASNGAQVPGKPKVAGNAPQNDTVPAMLSPGEVVIPNSIMQSSDPAGKAKAFVAAILAKNKKLGKA